MNAMLDKELLIGALKNDISVFKNGIDQATTIGKLIGKLELTSEFLSCLHEGRFDFVAKEVGQEVAEKQMDKAIESLHQVDCGINKINETEPSDELNETIDLLKD